MVLCETKTRNQKSRSAYQKPICWVTNLPINQLKKKSVNGIGSPGDKINIITAFKIHLDAF